MEKIIYSALEDSIRIKRDFIKNNIANIIFLSKKIAEAFTKDNKLLLCGNGGSAADAQHIAGELVGRYKLERRGIPAIALTVDTSSLTALGNDYGFETIFERQLEALAQKNDAVIGISTSGNSENVVRALKKANALGAETIGLVGNDGGKIKEVANLSIVIPSNDTARIQEVHITIGHIICELIEEDL